MKVASLKTITAALFAVTVGSAMAENWWYGRSETAYTDPTDKSNWLNSSYDETIECAFRHSDIADIAKNNHYTLDFSTNRVVASGAWIDTATANAVTPFVWTGTTGGFEATGDFAIGTQNTGSLTIEGGEHNFGGEIYVSRWDGANTGVLKMTGGVLTGGKVHIAPSANNTGIATIEGGELISKGDIFVGQYGTGELIVNGGTVRADYWFPTARDGAATKATIRLYDGEISAACHDDGAYQQKLNGNGVLDLCDTIGSTALFEQYGGTANFAGSNNGDDYGIAIKMGSATETTSEVKIMGGTMNAYGQICVGYSTGSNNKLTVGPGATLKTACIKTANATDGDVANNTVTFNGCTIQPVDTRTDFVDGKFTASVGANGVTIDTAYDVTIVNALGAADAGQVTGGLVKKGSGTLILKAAPSFPGEIDVQEGAVILPLGSKGYTISSSTQSTEATEGIVLEPNGTTHTGMNWTGASTKGTLFSDDYNWEAPRPADSTDAIRFDTQTDKTVTFDGVYHTTKYVWVGSTTDNTYIDGDTVHPTIWDSDYGTERGLISTGKLVIANDDTQNGALKIKDGAYEFVDTNVEIGLKEGRGYLELAGGSLTSDNINLKGSGAVFKVTGGTLNVDDTVWCGDNDVDTTLTFKEGATYNCRYGIGKVGTGTLTITDKSLWRLWFVSGTVVAPLGTDFGYLQFSEDTASKIFKYDLSDRTFTEAGESIVLAKFSQTDITALGDAGVFAAAHVQVALPKKVSGSYTFNDNKELVGTFTQSVTHYAPALTLDFEGDDWTTETTGWESVGSGGNNQGSRSLYDGTNSKFLRFWSDGGMQSGARDHYVLYNFPAAVTGTKDYRLEFDWFATRNYSGSRDLGLYISSASGSLVKMLTNGNAYDNQVAIFLNDSANPLETMLAAAPIQGSSRDDTRNDSALDSNKSYWYHIIIAGNEDDGLTLTVQDYEGSTKLTTDLGVFRTVTQIKDDLNKPRSNFAVYGGFDDIVVFTPAVAQIDGTYYASLALAGAAAKSGDEIKLLSDIVLTETTRITMGATINLNTHTLTTTDTNVQVAFDDDIHFLSYTDVDGTRVFSSEVVAVLNNYIWTGNAENNLWSDKGNWYEDTVPDATKETIFPEGTETVTVDLTGDATIGALTLRCPVKFINGTLTLTSITGSDKVTLGEGAGLIADGDITFGMPLGIEGSSTFIRATASSQKITLAGALTGEGTLTLDPDGARSYVNWTLSGDNSTFKGTVNAPMDDYTSNYFHFTGTSSVSKLAKWNVYTGKERYSASGGVSCGNTIDASSSARTFEFGELSGLYKRTVPTSYTGINYLKIGNRNTDFELGGQFGTTSDRRDYITKVGSGKMTFSGSNVGKFTVEGGKLVITSAGAFAYTPTITMTNPESRVTVTAEAAEAEGFKSDNVTASLSDTDAKHYTFQKSKAADGSWTFWFSKNGFSIHVR